MDLFSDKKGLSSVFAEEPSSVLRIHGEDFRAIGIANFHLKHLQEKYDTYLQTGLFDAWSDENLTKLATVSQKRIFPAGHKIIQQGQISECFYIIQKGVVSVRAYPNEAEEIKKQELIIQQNLEKTKQKKSLHRYLDPVEMEKTYQNKISENQALLEGFREQRKAYLAEYGSIDIRQLTVKTTTLIKPSCFGENAILNPDKREPASVYAESYVEVLAVAKSQIAQSWVTKKFRKRLEKFSHAPPPVEDLHNMYKFKKILGKS